MEKFIRCCQIFLANDFWGSQQASCAINHEKFIVITVTTPILPLLNSMLNCYPVKMGACRHLFLKNYKVRWWCGFIVVKKLKYFLMWFTHTIPTGSRLFFLFPSHFVRDKKRKDASRHQNEKKLSGSTAHINNSFGAHNIGATIGMSGVQYSGSYWENCSGTISKRSVPVDNNMAVILSVVHTDINYSL